MPFLSCLKKSRKSSVARCHKSSFSLSVSHPVPAAVCTSMTTEESLAFQRKISPIPNLHIMWTRRTLSYSLMTLLAQAIKQRNSQRNTSNPYKSKPTTSLFSPSKKAYEILPKMHVLKESFVAITSQMKNAPFTRDPRFSLTATSDRD